MAQISVGATKNVILVHGGFVDGSNAAPIMHDLIIIGAAPGGIALAVEAFTSGIGPSQILIFETRGLVEDGASSKE